MQRGPVGANRPAPNCCTDRLEATRRRSPRPRPRRRPRTEPRRSRRTS